MGKNKNGLPDRWQNYSNMGRAIPGTRFISFKVPLDEKFEKHGSNFSVRDLTDHCPQLGLVIDLTNTNKYYDPQGLQEQRIEYTKIKTEGHVLPSNTVVRQFVETVNAFLEKNEGNDKLVGVHCTHGVNRTGYLVCRYMIQVMDVAPDQAISDFNSARGHVLERHNYTDNLRKATWIDEDPASYKAVDTTYGSNARGGRGGYNNNRGGYNNCGNRYKRQKSGHGDSDYNFYAQQGHPDDCGDYYADDDRTPKTPVTPPARGGDSVFNTSDVDNSGGSKSSSRRQSRSYLRARTTLTPDGSSSWRVTSLDRSKNSDVEEDSQGTTPRGVKRQHDATDVRSPVRGPWLPPWRSSNDRSLNRSEEPPRLKFKRASSDPRYGKNQSYDPYFYQQRQGGGPTRRATVPEPVPTRGGRSDGKSGDTKQYKGPKRYRSPDKQPSNDDDQNTENIELLELKNNEPLTIPGDVSLRKYFLKSPPSGPGRDPKSPCTQPDVFSPDSTPGGSSTRRRSKRYEPY